MDIIISKSKKNDKKFDAIINNKKVISFGQKNASDFTIHKDEARKQLYLNRHKKREDPTNPLSKSFYSTNLLWNKPTLTESIKDINKRFKNLHIQLKK